MLCRNYYKVLEDLSEDNYYVDYYDVIRLLIEQGNFSDETLINLWPVCKLYYDIIIKKFNREFDNYISNPKNSDTITLDIPTHMIWTILIKNPRYIYDKYIKFNFNKCDDCDRYNILCRTHGCVEHKRCDKFACFSYCLFSCKNCDKKIKSKNDGGYHYTMLEYPECQGFEIEYNKLWCDYCFEDIEFHWHGMSPEEYAKEYY